ncbi:hypothetical protein Q7P36_000629 [Cladosporium allicinum]
MAPSDSKEPFLRIPWTAALLSAPNLITRIPDSRLPKPSNEDSFFATTLKTPSTLRSCITVYRRPTSSDPYIPSVSTFITLGSALDGHPGILHGGAMASLLDEGMGILLTVNMERDHFIAVGKGFAEGESPAGGVGEFYGVSEYQVFEAGEEWGGGAGCCLNVGGGEDDSGEVVVCASAEGLFVVPREGSRL